MTISYKPDGQNPIKQDLTHAEYTSAERAKENIKSTLDPIIDAEGNIQIEKAINKVRTSTGLRIAWKNLESNQNPALKNLKQSLKSVVEELQNNKDHTIILTNLKFGPALAEEIANLKTLEPAAVPKAPQPTAEPATTQLSGTPKTLQQETKVDVEFRNLMRSSKIFKENVKTHDQAIKDLQQTYDHHYKKMKYKALLQPIMYEDNNKNLHISWLECNDGHLVVAPDLVTSYAQARVGWDELIKINNKLTPDEFMVNIMRNYLQERQVNSLISIINREVNRKDRINIHTVEQAKAHLEQYLENVRN